MQTEELWILRWIRLSYAHRKQNRSERNKRMNKLVLIQGHAKFIREKAVFLKLMVEAIFAVRKQVEKTERIGNQRKTGKEKVEYPLTSTFSRKEHQEIGLIFVKGLNSHNNKWYYKIKYFDGSCFFFLSARGEPGLCIE